MKVLVPGHGYELQHVDGKKTQTVHCVNREPGTESEGTQTQEFIRVAIDRTMHCDNCLRWARNDEIIYHLRMALLLHEIRAMERKVEKGLLRPENVAIGKDGHFILELNAASFDNQLYSAKAKPDTPLRVAQPDFCKKEPSLT